MEQEARGIAEAWSRVVAHLGIAVEAERLESAAAALGQDPATAWAIARRELAAHGAPAHVVRRALFALFGVVTDRDPAVAEQAAPAFALLAGAPSLAAISRTGKPNLVERVHDGPLQEAIALQMRVRENPDFAEIDHALSGLVASLRGVIAADPARRDMTLEAQLGAAARRCHWAHVELTCQVPQGLSDEVADVVLRVVQESLANLRHADAHVARVTVREELDELRVTVEDDGAGFDPRTAMTPRPGHLGLPWLQDAVAASGGELRVRSAPGLGSCVSASLPLACGPARSERLTDSLTA